MSDFYDRLDTRLPSSREAALFRDLKAIVSVAKPRAPGLRRQLKGVNIAEIRHRDDLPRIPVLRKQELSNWQIEEPPYGGHVPTRGGALRHMLPGTIGGNSRDWWGTARALSAAGFTKNDTILNCCSYHLSADGHMIESGAQALNCPVIPAGTAKLERKLEAIHMLQPTAYCGKPDHLRQILDKAAEMNRDVSSLNKALVFGAPLMPHVRREIEARGVCVRQAYATSALGIVAYETACADGTLNEGMVVNEGFLIEVLRIGTNEPLPPGEIGEIVVTRVNADYPMLRFATGDLSMILADRSPCGRTNLRLKGWMGKVAEAVHFGDHLIVPAHVMEIGARHSDALRVQLVLRTRAGEDEVVLRAEGDQGDTALAAFLQDSLRTISVGNAIVEIVPLGGLSDDAAFIVDERVPHGA